VDEHAETLPADEEPDNELHEQHEPTLTQRELVRASLLRCPPQPPATEQPRR
jgi:hypothetical protein